MNFKFVDLIRFFSMVAIVYSHTLGAFFILNNAPLEASDAWAFVPMKFGTLCFYLISGFLLGEKITQTPSLTYLKRRYDNTFRPYIITVLCFIAIRSIGFIFGTHQVRSVEEFGVKLGEFFIYAFFYTNYWFILNFFLSLSIILLFKKYLFTYAFPIILFLITLIYTVNVYVEYFTPIHTVALFGYLFYLWLGIIINKYKTEIISYIDNKSLAVYLILAGLLIGSNIYEAYVLQALKSVDIFNTLKISNQLYSLAIFFLFIKIRNLKLPSIFNPKKDTYGMYLYHPFTLLIVPKALLLLGYTPIPKSGYFMIILFFGFIGVYLLTLLAVKCKNNSTSKWSEEIRIFIQPQKT